MKIGTGTGRTARWLLAVVMAFGASVAMAQATSGITITKHNLGSTNTLLGTPNENSGTTEICVFCHTPHAAVAGSAPLWNKATQTTSYTSYTAATSSTLDGQVLGVGSVSLACLSCHDGTQAMDNMVNAPGSGLAQTGTWGWTGGNVTAAGLLTGVANLGSDLQNDHPIGIKYCGGGYTNASATGTCVDADFKDLTSAMIGTERVFWVETGVNTTRQKTDMTLYNRSFGAGDIGPSVECASCHDPHTSAQSTFLRISNSGSGVCLACHSK